MPISGVIDMGVNSNSYAINIMKINKLHLVRIRGFDYNMNRYIKTER